MTGGGPPASGSSTVDGDAGDDGGSLAGCAAAFGQPPAGAGIRSPWRRWALSAGFAMVIVTHGLLLEPVWWQMVVLAGGFDGADDAGAGAAFGFAGGAAGRSFLTCAWRFGFGFGATGAATAGAGAGAAGCSCLPCPCEPSCGTPPLSATAAGAH